jgi:hypothetical protein
MEQELKEFLGRLLMFILLEPFSSRRLNPNQFNETFLSDLKLEETQIDLLNCLGIFTVLVPHPILEYQKQKKTYSSLGFNPNTKSVKIYLRSMIPAVLIKINNRLQSYQNYYWFSLAIYEAVISINQSLNAYYINRLEGQSYKIRLYFDGIMFKYEDTISAAAQIDYNLNLIFINNTYKISDPNLEMDYLNQIKNPYDDSNVCNEFINRISYLINKKYQALEIDKATGEIEFSSNLTTEEEERVNKNPTNQDADEELPQLVDRWDSTWRMKHQSSAIMYILDKIDITIYEASFSYRAKENQYIDQIPNKKSFLLSLPKHIKYLLNAEYGIEVIEKRKILSESTNRPRIFLNICLSPNDSNKSEFELIKPLSKRMFDFQGVNPFIDIEIINNEPINNEPINNEDSLWDEFEITESEYEDYLAQLRD